ncbi:conserved hypothetical protein, partial [Listeria innocua FSL S4-378]
HIFIERKTIFLNLLCQIDIFFSSSIRNSYFTSRNLY